MRYLAKITTGAVALAIVCAPLLVASSAAAETTDVVTARAAAVPPVNPAGPGASSPRQFMLNVLGKVLGSAMPSAWQREQIADKQRYNFDWETLEAQFGTDPANPDYMGQPDSYGDYVIQKQEMALKGGTKLFGSSSGSKYSIPAIKPSKFGKAATVAGGAVSSIFSAQIGFGIGNGIDQAIGIDSNGLVCGPAAGGASALLALATGNDCSAYDNAMSEAQKNADAGTTAVSAGVSCDPDVPTQCAQATARDNQNPGYTCFTATGSGNVYVVFQGSDPSSGWSQQGVPVGGDNFWPGCPTGTNNDLSAPGGVQAYCVDAIVATCDPSDVETVTDASADPNRVLHCSVTGTDGETYTQDSAPFKESDGSLAGPSCPTLPDGVYPAEQTVTENGGGNSNQLSDQTMTPDALAQLQDYPECTTGACKLDLIDHLHGDKSCFDEQATCDGWFSDPNKADDYQCTFGIHDVEQQNCYVYSGVFNAGRQQIGAPYSDPETGTWSGGQNSASEGGQAYDQTIQDPDTSVRDCLGTASTTFDPIAWVMRPVQCALEWAFVPRSAVVGLEAANVTAAWSGTIFGQIGTIVAQFQALPIFTGCDGLPIDIDEVWPTHWGIHWTLGAACSGDLATAASTVRGIVGALISLAGVLALTRYIARAVGYTGFGSRGIPND